MYIYEDHMGGLYTSDRELSYDEVHCVICGDTDWFIGYAETKEEAWNLLKEDVDINGSGGWDYEYIIALLNSDWDGDFVPTIHTYDDINCPECGSSLDVYYDGPNKHDDTSLIRHCYKCDCDWESELHEDGSESELRRKFWG